MYVLVAVISGISLGNKPYISYDWSIVSNACPSKRSQKSLRCRKLVPFPLTFSEVRNCRPYFIVCADSQALGAMRVLPVYLRLNKELDRRLARV